MTTPTLAPAGAPALDAGPVCETVHVHGLTGVETPCCDPAATADLLARTCGCAPMHWGYSCAACAVQGTTEGFACVHCWAPTVSVLCTVPLGVPGA